MEKSLTEYLKQFNIEQEFKGAYSKINLITIDGEKMIIKHFNRKDYYETEKNVLKKVQAWEECFPKIKYYDNNNKIVVMKYVGENLYNIIQKNPNFNIADYEEKLYECNQKLRRAGYIQNDCTEKNMCIDDEGVLRLIDFECSHKNLLDRRRTLGPFAYRKWASYRPDEKQKENIPILDKKYGMDYWFAGFYHNKELLHL